MPAVPYAYANSAQSQPRTDERISVLVSFDEHPANSGQSLVRSYGGEVIRDFNNFPVLEVELPEAAIVSLQANPSVVQVENNYEVHALDYVPEDEIGNSWGIGHIGADETMADGNRGENVKVAVIDSGVDYEHPDLAPNLDSDNLGYDAVEDNDDPMDIYGHGTHVAGSLGAVADDFGVVGVAPDVDMYALRVLDDEGVGSNGAIIAALDWVADYNDAHDTPIQITNNSYGSGGSTNALEDAFSQLADDTLHIAASGNSGNRGGNNDSVIYPAKYDSVVAVGAVDENNDRPSWSSTGPDVEFVAPGVSVLSTWNGPESYADPQPILFSDSDGNVRYYKEGSGTSMASPHVAGVGALMWGVNADLSTDEIRDLMHQSAVDTGLRDNAQGSGLLRADKAVSAAADTAPAATGSVTGTVTDGDTGVESATITVGEDTTVTDSEGAFELNNIEVNEYELSVEADGYYDYNKVIEIFEDEVTETTIELEAVPTHNLAGSVSDEAGQVLSGVNLNLNGHEATTNTDGVFEFEAVEEGDYHLTATKEGYEALEKEVELNNDMNLELTLEESAKQQVDVDDISYSTRGGRSGDRHLEVSILATDQDDGGLSGASVSFTLMNTDNGEQLSYTEETDSDGGLTVSKNHAADGCYEVKIESVEVEGYQWDGQTPQNSYCK